MSLWNINTPSIIFDGFGSIDNLNSIIPKNISNIFLVIDPSVYKSDFGLKVIHQLTGYKTQIFIDFTSDPDENSIIEGSNLYNSSKSQCIIAVGGGSAIDAAKMIGLLGENDFELESYFNNNDNYRNEKFPFFVAVPTTCGTGAESSPYSVIKNTTIPCKRTIKRNFFIPKAVILDPESIISLPTEYTVATALDTLCHIIEVHTASTSNDLVRITTRGSLSTFGKYFNEAIYNNNLVATGNLLYTAFTSRLLYPGTGLSAAHSLAHPFGTYMGLHHGMTVSMIIPEVIRFNECCCSEHLKEAATLLDTSLRDGFDIANWIHNIINTTGLKEIIKEKLKGKTIPIDKICNQAMKSSNLASNSRKINNISELKEILEQSLCKIM